MPTPTDKTEELMRGSHACEDASSARTLAIERGDADAAQAADVALQAARATLRAAILDALTQARADGRAETLAEIDALGKPTPEFLAAFDALIDGDAPAQSAPAQPLPILPGKGADTP